jgi:hypothetical protein
MRFQIRFPALSSAWPRALMAPALVFIATATDRQYLVDFWHHLARGRAIVEQRQLVNHDLFTYTVAGQPLVDVNWLTQVFYYCTFELGGMPLVQLINAIVLAAMAGILVHLCWRASGSAGIGSAMAIFAFFGLWQVLTVRPQTFSLLLFVLLYEILLAAKQRPVLLLAPPFLLALWANVHGAFPIGLVLIGSFWLAAAFEGWSRGRRTFFRDHWLAMLTLCLAGSLAATLINPYGWRVYQYVLVTSSSAASRRIDEWVPPGLDLLIGKFWVASLVAVLLGFGLSPRRPSARDVCLLVCFLPLACGSVRMIAWWLLVSAPVIAAQVSALPIFSERPASREGPTFASALAAGVLVLLMVLSVPGLDRYNPLLGPARRAAGGKEADLAALASCIEDRGRGGRLFSRFEWSEYLTWSLGPRFPVFMDGRIEIFPDDVWAQYAAVTVGRAQWHDVLDRYKVDYLLLDRPYHGATGLLPQVEQSTDWQLIFQSGEAMLYARPSAESGIAMKCPSP